MQVSDVHRSFATAARDGIGQQSSPPLSSLMHDAFAALLRQPTARRYKQLRSQLLAAGLPGDFSLRLAEVERLTAQQECVEATALAGELLSTGLLSLRLHRLGGQLALAQGQQERAELHRFTYDAVSAAILATGNGTRRRPLLVTYGSDAAELLAARGFEVLSQSLIEENARRYDVVLCSGEREFWFDVTDLLPLTAISAIRPRRPKAGASAKLRRERAVSGQ
jgi:hypothetical protein